MCGLSQNPWGWTVQFSCVVNWVSGSVQVKASIFCDWASRGIEKNAFLRSMTEKWEVPKGIVVKSVQMLATTELRGTIVELMCLRSWTRWSVPLGFLTASVGVLKGEEVWQRSFSFLTGSEKIRLSSLRFWRERDGWAWETYLVECSNWMKTGEWCLSTEGFCMSQTQGAIWEAGKGNDMVVLLG